MTAASPTIRARWATASEISDWDGLLTENPGGADFLLSKTFATAKELLGWRAYYLVFDYARNATTASPRTGERKSVAVLFERKIPLLGRLWYITRGPAVKDAAELATHVAALKELAAGERR